MEWKDRLLFAYDLQWFAKDGPGGEKTEPATEKKLREAREDGKVAKSKELTAAFDLIVLFLVLKVFISLIGNGFLEVFYYVYKLMPDFVSVNAMESSTKEITSFLDGCPVFCVWCCGDSPCKYPSGRVESHG